MLCFKFKCITSIANWIPRTIMQHVPVIFHVFKAYNPNNKMLLMNFAYLYFTSCRQITKVHEIIVPVESLWVTAAGLDVLFMPGKNKTDVLDHLLHTLEWWRTNKILKKKIYFLTVKRWVTLSGAVLGGWVRGGEINCFAFSNIRGKPRLWIRKWCVYIHVCCSARLCVFYVHVFFSVYLLLGF